jgi:hypothetical protein
VNYIEQRDNNDEGNGIRGSAGQRNFAFFGGEWNDDCKAEAGIQMTEIELFRQEGKEFRSVHLRVGPDGSVSMDAQDIGPLVEKICGADEYEFGVHVPTGASPKLIFALLRDKYLGRGDAADEFREFCKKEGIGNEWRSWS